MEFSNKTYFKKLLGILSEYGGLEASFHDPILEKQFRQVNLQKHVMKSTNLNFFFFIIFLLGLYQTIKANKGLITGSYFIIAGILIDLCLAKLTCYFYSNYQVFKIIKTTRFFFMYINITVNWILYSGENINEVNVVRLSYNFLLVFNCVYIFFIDFNYILLAIIPILNVGVLYSIQRTRNLVYHQMLPEIIVNILYYYSTFVMKKSEFLYEKQAFLESKKNENYIEYTNNLINTLNTLMISIDHQNILFVNQSAIYYFKNNYDNLILETNFTSKEDIIENENFVKNNYNVERFFLSFFTSLILDNSSIGFLNSGMNFKEIINKLYSETTFSTKELVKIGTFSEIGKRSYFEIYVRKLNYSQEALEILLYNITDIKTAEKISIESKYKQKIFAKIAHEFKTPLLTIISLIDKIKINQNNSLELNSKITKNLNNITNLSNYTLSLITDIVHYVSGSNNLKLNVKEITIKDSLDFSFNVLRTLIECNENKKNKIKPILEIDNNLDRVKITTDENRLKQIILNFISNSFKFTLCGFIKIKAKLKDRRKFVEISVKDSGIGIKYEDHNKIFQDYTDISLGEDHNIYGSGLGLAITKNLANSLNYKIGFKSEFSKGSKFFVRINCIEKIGKKISSKSLINSLSLQLSQKEEIDEIRSYKNVISKNSIANQSRLEDEGLNIISNSNDCFCLETKRIEYDLIKTEELCVIQDMENSRIEDMENFKIVVVDDNKLVRETTVNSIRSVLTDDEKLKLEIIEYIDGIDLLAAIKDDFQGKIKLIFVDENMNYLNGSDTIKIIRRLEKEKKINSYSIVSISAISDETTINNFLHVGFNSIISKPCKKGDLRHALNIYVNL